MLLQLEQLGERYNSLKIRVDEQEFKVANVHRNFEAVRNNISVTGGAGGGLGMAMGNGYDKATQLLNQVELETEIKLIRGQLIEERQKREQAFFEHHNLVAQL